MKTLQVTFDELLVHMRALSTAGRKGLVNDKPAYKTPDGESGCPVGMLLGKEVEEKGLNHKFAISREVSELLEKEGHNTILCQIIQLIHDQMTMDTWEDCMSVVARELRLSYTAPENYQVADGMDALSLESLVMLLKGGVCSGIIALRNWELTIKNLKLSAANERLLRLKSTEKITTELVHQ